MIQNPVTQCMVIVLLSFFVLFGTIVLYTSFNDLADDWRARDNKRIKSKWKMVVYYIIDTGFVIVIGTVDVLAVLSVLSLIWNIIKRLW